MNEEFAGFPRGTFDYLSDLSSHNSKDWFDDNRQRYEEFWKTPALNLTNALADIMADLVPPLKAEARINGTLRRINRDVRFSKDKSPYNPRIHLIFWTGSHPNRSPGFHFVVSNDGIGYGAGVFGLDGPALQTYRERILDTEDRAQLMRAITQAHNVQCDFDTPELKRLPTGYDTQDEWEHLLRRKSFVMRTLKNIPVPDWMHHPSCTVEISNILTDLQPLIRWLRL